MPEISFEEAMWRTLYHHPMASPRIIMEATGRKFDTPPPLPTPEDKRRAEEIVKKILIAHYSGLNSPTTNDTHVFWGQ
jgi:hypothetical protein